MFFFYNVTNLNTINKLLTSYENLIKSLKYAKKQRLLHKKLN